MRSNRAQTRYIQTQTHLLARVHLSRTVPADRKWCCAARPLSVPVRNENWPSWACTTWACSPAAARAASRTAPGPRCWSLCSLVCRTPSTGTLLWILYSFPLWSVPAERTGTLSGSTLCLASTAGRSSPCYSRWWCLGQPLSRSHSKSEK